MTCLVTNVHEGGGGLYSSVMVIDVIIEREQKNDKAAQILDPSSLTFSDVILFFFPCLFHSKALIHKWPRYHTVLREGKKSKEESQRTVT